MFEPFPPDDREDIFELSWPRPVGFYQFMMFAGLGMMTAATLAIFL
jgi:hypothetical protein